MTDGAGPPDEAASLNDPDWVDRMLERALESADHPEDTVAPKASESVATGPQKAEPGPVGQPPETELEPVGETAETPVPPVPGPLLGERVPDPVASESPQPVGLGSTEADDAAWSEWAAGGSPPAAASDRPSAASEPGEWAAAGPTAAVDISDAAGNEYEVEADSDNGESRKKTRARSIAEWGAVVVGAIVIALLVKTFLFQAFYIPSGSMEPTLSENDRVLVNKLSYDLHDVNRGDVVVFERPPEEQGDIEDLIKRVIALPGETITFRDGNVFIDDRELSESYLMEPQSTDFFADAIPNCEGSAAGGCTVPEGRVFVMGDNRRDSRDSRFFGPIEESTIVGRAFIKIWPVNDIGFL